MGKNLVVFFFEENSLDQIQKVVATKIASRDYYTALIIFRGVITTKATKAALLKYSGSSLQN